MRKFVAASLVVLVALAVAAAEEFTGFVTKFEGGKITVKKFKGKDAPPEEVTLNVAPNVKVMKGAFNKDTKKIDADGDYEGGKDALAKRVKEAADKAKEAAKDETKKGFGLFGSTVFAGIVTEGEGDAAKVTEIRVSKGFGKKKKDN